MYWFWIIVIKKQDGKKEMKKKKCSDVDFWRTWTDFMSRGGGHVVKSQEEEVLLTKLNLLALCTGGCLHI